MANSPITTTNSLPPEERLRRQISTSLGAADWPSARMSSILEHNRVIASTNPPSGAPLTQRTTQLFLQQDTPGRGEEERPGSHESYLRILIKLPFGITLKLGAEPTRSTKKKKQA